MARIAARPAAKGRRLLVLKCPTHQSRRRSPGSRAIKRVRTEDGDWFPSCSRRYRSLLETSTDQPRGGSATSSGKSDTRKGTADLAMASYSLVSSRHSEQTAKCDASRCLSSSVIHPEVEMAQSKRNSS